MKYSPHNKEWVWYVQKLTDGVIALQLVRFSAKVFSQHRKKIAKCKNFCHITEFYNISPLAMLLKNNQTHVRIGLDTYASFSVLIYDNFFLKYI